MSSSMLHKFMSFPFTRLTRLTKVSVCIMTCDTHVECEGSTLRHTGGREGGSVQAAQLTAPVGE